MSNNTEVIFENIEQRILKEIKDAHYAIFVSVAWFTNKKLFNALLEKAKGNCYVSIIIQLDDINSQSGIDYDQIQIGRSECFQISKDAELMHDKFCVIDFKKVITGSYNWTYKASQNSENILVLNNPSIATHYICRFEQQKAKFQESKIQEDSPVISEIKNIDSSKTTSYSVPTVSTIEQEPPSIKQCNHCTKEIEYNDAYCQYCGELQCGFQYKSIVVTCKNCLCKQEEALIDAASTKFCTFCGSNNLEWECV